MSYSLILLSKRPTNSRSRLLHKATSTYNLCN